MREYHSEKPSITLDLGNGKTRVYYNSIEVATEESTHWESDYIEVDNLSYDAVVNALIRERYTVDQEFALIRQQSCKPEEYQQYYEYCEECKAQTRVLHEAQG